MKAYQIGAQKGLDSLTLTDRPDPQPGPGQALVAMKAASLNHRDLNILTGTYGGSKPETRIPLSDGAGDVIAVGPGVTQVKPGDRVTAIHFTGWSDGAFTPTYFGSDLGVTTDGWLTEKALIPAGALVPIPASMSYAEAASLPVAAGTAWAVVETFARVKPGDVVLMLGTGGVSIFGLQIARMAGARAAITSSSDDKLAACKKMGADILVNYKTNPDWDKAVLQQTGGLGADIIIETGGMATLPKSLAAAAPNGRVGLIGGLGGQTDAPPNLGPMIGKNVILKGVTSGNRRSLIELIRALEINGVKPVIDRTFSFADAPAAFKYLRSGGHVGKVIVTNA